MNNCKICQSKYCQEINNLLSHNSIDSVYLWCKNQGFKVSKASLKNHALNHINMGEKDDKKKIEKEVYINFEDYCTSIGLYPKDFDNFEKNLFKITYGSGKGIVLILFKALAITDKKMSLCLEDENAKYPTLEIKGLKNIYEIYNAIFSNNTFTNSNSSMTNDQLLEILKLY
jgi:hypothetical protein